MSLTLSASLLAILYNLPIPALKEFSVSAGVGENMNAIINVYMNITALYMVLIIGC